MSVIAGDARSEPDHVGDAQVVRKGLLVILASHPRVALLNFAEQALFGGKKSSLPVHVDRSAFEYDALALELRAYHFSRGSLRHQSANVRVITPVWILRPRIELPMNAAESRRLWFGPAYGGARPYGIFTDYKGAAGIARPHTVCLPTVETDTLT